MVWKFWEIWKSYGKRGPEGPKFREILSHSVRYGMYELDANSEKPDQMPCSVASDLDLLCLPMSLLWDARLKWVKAWSNSLDPDQMQLNAASWMHHLS